MAEKLGLFAQWLGGDLAERKIINANAEALTSVENQLAALHATVERQATEIVELRATIMGLSELLRAKVNFEAEDLEREVSAAMSLLRPPPPAPPLQPLPPPSPEHVAFSTDPYRGLPLEPVDLEAIKRLMRSAEDHQFAKRFAEARAVYQQVVDGYPGTKQANAARAQLENLRDR